MTPHRYDGRTALYHGDALDVLANLADGIADAVVTDPPYGLGFMGKEWDSGKSFVERKPQRSNTFDHVGGNHNPTHSADAAGTRRVENAKYGEWCVGWAAECLRVLKPGGHLLAFGGTRTYHRLACAVEDAGFEIRDTISWLYGSGFPKSLDISKAIDKAAGAATDDARRGGLARPSWAGWGTALKPAHEPIVVARKPLAGTVAANVQAHGTGGLNVDGCRVAGAEDGSRNRPPSRLGSESTYAQDEWTRTAVVQRQDTTGLGRWPSNVVLDEHTAVELDRQSGVSTSQGGSRGVGARGYEGGALGAQSDVNAYGDTGGASRFFPVFKYQAKAPSRERPKVDGVAHPTVKPLELMRWLVRLVTPPDGIVLDPFAGSGTTAEACALEGMRCLAIECEPEYLPLILARLERVRVSP